MIFTPSPLIDLFIILIMLISILHVRFLYHRKRWVIFDPLNFFWAGVVVIYIKQPIEMYGSLIYWYGQDVILETLFWISFGLVFIIIGYESKWGVRWGNRIPPLPHQLSPKALFITSLVLIIAGLYGWNVLFDSAGGLTAWAATARGGTDYENLSGYSQVLSGLLSIGVGLLVLHVEMHRVQPPLRILAWILLGVLFLWMFYIGSRSRIIMTVATALMSWYLPRRKNPSLFLLVPIFLMLIVSTNFLANYRGYFTDLSFNLDKMDSSEVAYDILPGFVTGKNKNTVLESKGSEFSCTAAVIDLVPSEVSYNYGYALLEFIARPIPRAVWPDKRYPHYEAFTPIYEKAHLTDTWYPSTVPILVGPAFGYIGHWYAIGGPVALILVGFLTGGLFRLIRSIYDRPARNQGDLVLYIMLAPIGFGEAAATPLFWIFSLPFMLIPLIAFIYFSRKKTKKYKIVSID